MKLKEIKFIDLKENQKYDFIFPIGSTEQHGPFIPFGTDTYITDYIVNKASIEFPEIIIMPTLEYSRSQEHRGFYGTLWLTEKTLESVMVDICNSIKDRARNIFIISFHANDLCIDKFIGKKLFKDVNIVNLRIIHKDDDKYIEEKILKGPFDGHAGNSEISNMLVIDKKLVKLPSKNYPKHQVKDPFGTDNLIEKSQNGIADNHPKWNISSKNGKEILDIYVKRVIKNLKNY